MRKTVCIADPIFFYPRPFETVSQCTNTHACHLEWSERSCIFSYMRRKDFSPLARNDNCDTVSLGLGEGCSG